jgi:membrane protein DedA with SNARE-associated domain/rhodanese-related sulfurtransferase
MESLTNMLAQHGALVLFAVVFAEQVGLPFPALPLLVAGGVLVGTGHLAWSSALGAAILATLMADAIWYLAGQWRGRPVLSLLCLIALEPDACVRRTEDFFLRHGPKSLIVGKFIPGLSTIAPPLAGIVGLSVPLFLLYDTLGALLWAGSGLEFGYAFSGQIEQAFAYSEQVMPALLLTMVFLLAGFVSLKAWRRHRQLRLVPRMTVAELAEKLTAAEPPVLIDVRPRARAEAEPGIPTAVLMSLDELARRYQEFPRHRDVVVYCGCPADVVSAQGALLLQKKGFTRVWPLAGGIEAWRAAATQNSESTQVFVGPKVAA